MTALSQINSSSSSSSHSVLTQISLHRSGHNSQTNVFSNEALCLEVLNILKRCYMRQADIRAKLYGGLNDAVNHNPELALPVLNVLWVQFLKYYNVDEDVLPPIDFSKITVVKDTDVIVQVSTYFHALYCTVPVQTLILRDFTMFLCADIRPAYSLVLDEASLIVAISLRSSNHFHHSQKILKLPQVSLFISPQKYSLFVSDVGLFKQLHLCDCRIPQRRRNWDKTTNLFFLLVAIVPL